VDHPEFMIVRTVTVSIVANVSFVEVLPEDIHVLLLSEGEEQDPRHLGGCLIGLGRDASAHQIEEMTEERDLRKIEEEEEKGRKEMNRQEDLKTLRKPLPVMATVQDKRVQQEMIAMLKTGTLDLLARTKGPTHLCKMPPISINDLIDPTPC